MGIFIIYQHLFVIYIGCKRVPELVIILGALTGIIIGIQNKNALVYIPFIYSFLSKVPVYVTNVFGQIRTIFLTVIISIILEELLSPNKINNKRKKKYSNNKKNNSPLFVKVN